jgi:hypothetical protein
VYAPIVPDPQLVCIRSAHFRPDFGPTATERLWFPTCSLSGHR